MVVAVAAPTTPISGNGPSPKMSVGPSTMLIVLANHSTRINGRVSGAAKHRVDEEQQRHGAAAAQHHARERRSCDDHRIGRSHGANQLRAEERADAAQHERRDAAEDDRLHGGHGGTVRILLADAPRDRGRRADGHADGQRIHDEHQ